MKILFIIPVFRNLHLALISSRIPPCPYRKYKSQIKKLENCHKSNIPIGIIFKTVKDKNKILWLGKIVSSEGTNPNKKNHIQIIESMRG